MEENKKSTTPASEKNTPVKAPVYLLVIIALLAITIGILGYMYHSYKQEATSMQQELEQQKNELANELQDISVKYDSLKTDNDSMNLKLEQEQAKIKRLLALRASNLEKIKIYKNELTTLREVMKGYITQIDSLNTLNKQLTAENIMVKSEYKRVESVNKELSEKNISLASTVEMAKIMKADNVVVTAVNERSKDIAKAKKVDKIKVCFTLFENKVVQAGTKDVFIRIITPSNYVLVNSEDNLFTVEGDQIVYTETRQIQYENKNIDLCIFWKNNGELATGEYQVFVYTEGHEIGGGSLTLK